MTHMKLECPNCGKEVPADNINMQQTLAVCPACDTVFNFSGGDVNVMAGQAQPVKPKNKFSQYEVAMPNRFDVQETDKQMTISYSWFSPTALFLTFFAIIWNGMIFGIFLPAMDGFGSLGFPFAFFPLIFAGVGLFLIYLNVGQYINRTYIITDARQMRIFSRPLPTFNNQTINHDDIQQLFVQQYVNHGKNGTTVTYGVVAIIQGGHRQKLISQLEKPEQALYIEQELEKYLGIADAPVRGEYGNRSY